MKTASHSGFTLVELLVVATIIAVMVTLGGANYVTSRIRSRDAERIAELKAIAAAQEQYFGETGAYNIISSPSDAKCGSTGSFANNLISGGIIPTDPINSSTQFYDCLYNLNTASSVWKSDAFCIEVALEKPDNNAAAICSHCACQDDGTDCTFDTSGTLDHFCVKNQQ